MKRYVIGDIHGAARALTQVLDRAGFDHENDELISVGDVCDGWSETAECIEILMGIKHLVYCRGNHDDWTLSFLAAETIESSNYYSWLHHGGKATLASYEKNPHLKAKHLDWLRKSLIYYIDEENRLFLHAGFNPIYAIDKQPRDLNDDETSDGVPSIYFWDRRFWSHVSHGFAHPNCKQFTEIYIGHTPTFTYWPHGRPVNFDNVWNMDTGAAFTGKLSLMNIETKELFQSDPVPQLYPGEKGRN